MDKEQIATEELEEDVFAEEEVLEEIDEEVEDFADEEDARIKTRVCRGYDGQV